MRSALVGTGAIARQHLACLAQLPGVEIAGVCDLSRSSAEWAAERYGAGAWFTDFEEMLSRTRPDVVHVTTPVTSHFLLAMASLQSGAHVVLEKPATVTADELEALLDQGGRAGLALVEDYNYLFNPPVRSLLELAARGELGDVVHAEAAFATDIMRADSPFDDPDTPHPAVSLPGGPVGDFVTHLAALAHAVVGAHRSVQTLWSDEGRGDGVPTELVALVEAERANATLRFSSRTKPSTFSLGVSGSQRSATATIGDGRLVIRREVKWRRPLHAIGHGMASTAGAARASVRVPWQRLAGGPGPYIGLWELLRLTYDALRAGASPPVSPRQIADVNRLRWDVIAQDSRP